MGGKSKGLNPFSSGQVFRKIFQSSYFWYWLILIPLEQGGVFRLYFPLLSILLSLNPFGTGRRLSTDPRELQGRFYASQSLWNRAGSFDYPRGLWLYPCFVSIPLEQDWVFRQSLQFDERIQAASQSLWNRAVSFDCKCLIAGKAVISLNPFRTRRCLSTQ